MAFQHCSYKVILFNVCYLLHPIIGKILSATVIPHGDFCYDPSLVNYTNGSQELHAAAIEVGAYINSLKPDYIFLTTPHGLALTTDYAFYQNSNGSGFALIGGDLHNASFPEYKVYLDTSLAPAVIESILALLDNVPNISGLSAFADTEAMALRWGEVVPLSFLRDTTSNNFTKTMIMSMPTKRYTDSEGMVPELLSLGTTIGLYLESLTESVSVIISSDLAHTHIASGPYGYSPTSEPFDLACGLWAKTLEPEPLLVVAKSLVGKALSCGFTGLVFLHGLLTSIPVQWTPKLYANYHPTYYGMLVADFRRNS